jgi:uncharacterized protein YacL (UPF0231 family)
MQLEFYRDAAGDPRARCKGAAGEALARFLESDLQGSVKHGREILRALGRVEAGKLGHWEKTGNAFTLTLSPDGATLVDEAEEETEPVEIPLARLKEAVADWTAFVKEG